MSTCSQSGDRESRQPAVPLGARTVSEVGERTGQRFTLGRRVEVKLMEATPVTGGLVFEMLSDPEPRDPNAPAPRLGMRGRGGDGPVKRGKNRPGGPKPRNGSKPSGGLKGVRKGKRR